MSADSRYQWVELTTPAGYIDAVDLRVWVHGEATIVGSAFRGVDGWTWTLGPGQPDRPRRSATLAEAAHGLCKEIIERADALSRAAGDARKALPG